MSANQVNKDILAFGGLDGGKISDASVGTAVLTGLKAVWIEVLSDTTFSVLTGLQVSEDAAYEGMGVNVPTGVAVVGGARFGHPYEGYYTAISHNGGQITVFSKTDS